MMNNSDKENLLNKKILMITMLIQLDFPELSKYLNEMPVKYQLIKERDPGLISLEEYYNSLCSLYRSYKIYV